MILTLLSIALQSLAIIALADFAAGIIHWAEDAYFTEDTPVLGRLLIRPNIVHHHYPRFFTRYTWLQSSWDLLVVGIVVLAAAWTFNVLTWQVWLFVIVSVNANEVHKWSHRTRKENGPVISKLQDWRILQTPNQHALHHTDPKNTHYCPVTNMVNPVLEKLHFWTGLEWIIWRLTGARHKQDTSVRGQGPGPGWLAEYRPVTPVPTPAKSTPATSKTCCGNCARCRHNHAKAVAS
ncbi:MAG TPA: fatty acid desaturase CarF family protein [Rariglobus sp.]|jgi:ubiquitin-conjugating enzyme E2 variant|nr:fatty acid desaturase CarF family protein [Rariglobus sp.]